MRIRMEGMPGGRLQAEADTARHDPARQSGPSRLIAQASDVRDFVTVRLSCLNVRC